VNPRRIPVVKAGARIEKGQFLTDGSADLSELFKYAGKEKTQEYIISEVVKIYELQGANISIKHLEVIIRQMFSRVKITHGGTTESSPGDVMSFSDFEIQNKAVVESGGEAAKAEPLVMGILDVSLSRASFLSAASFQNTTRMLIKASIYGALDKLEGLKENVILGRLIPAGTGFKGSVKEKLVNKYAPAAGDMMDERVRPPLARGE
jgi:DNA-directed RNA polymerase subunit beta'